MNKIPAEVQEFVEMLKSKGAEVRVGVIQCTETALKEPVNELVDEMKEQASIQDLPFDIALMAVKTNRNVKRKNWTDKVLVDVNDFVYMQDTVGGNIVKYEATFEDINAKDWVVYE